VLAQPADAELEPERREGEGVMADAWQVDDVVRLGRRARNPHLVAPVATAGDALGQVGVVARLLEGERHRPRGRGGLPETVLLHEGARRALALVARVVDQVHAGLITDPHRARAARVEEPRQREERGGRAGGGKAAPGVRSDLDQDAVAASTTPRSARSKAPGSPAGTSPRRHAAGSPRTPRADRSP